MAVALCTRPTHVASSTTMEPPLTPTSASPSPPAQAGAAPSRTHTETRPLTVGEIVQRDLETRTRAVVDSLYELASRAADIQPSGELGANVYAHVFLADAATMWCGAWPILM